MVPLALGVAVEEDLVFGYAGEPCQVQLANGEDVSTCPLLGQDAEHCQVAIGLDCKILISIRKSAVVGANVLPQPGLAGDVQWRAEFFDEID
ncbi:Uncharacterised protein [uncultured archaeon]|nr:Uncharacterised protein [uncultured archaeon]